MTGVRRIRSRIESVLMPTEGVEQALSLTVLMRVSFESGLYKKRRDRGNKKRVVTQIPVGLSTLRI